MNLQNTFGISPIPGSLYQQRYNRLLQQLFLLSMATCCVLAGPVSNPDRSSKLNQQINSVSGGVNQQQQAAKQNTQESHLNTINAYAASNYDGISEVEFKPSYKLPEIESNLTPIQNGVSIGALNVSLSSPTPVIMQYLAPRSLHESGVQYLQFIPTRPLIVPISPFLSPQSPSPYHHALASENPFGDYGRRSSAVLTPLPRNNVNTHPHTNLVSVQSSQLPYGLNAYANAVQPHHANFRINREAKDKHIPTELTLNMHEYLPQEFPHHAYFRGRPSILL